MLCFHKDKSEGHKVYINLYQRVLVSSILNTNNVGFLRQRSGSDYRTSQLCSHFTKLVIKGKCNGLNCLPKIREWKS